MVTAEVGVILSPGLLKCVINNTQKEDNMLNAAAKHFVSYSTPSVSSLVLKYVLYIYVTVANNAF